MEKKKLKMIIGSIIFNIAETLLILLIGFALNLQIKHILIVMLSFLISRGLFGMKAIHFKDWYRCLVWSLLIMFSLFVLFKVDLVISIMLAMFSALIMSNRCNILELYLWSNRGEPSKYQDVMEFVKDNELDNRLIEFESKIKQRGNLEYSLYKYRFKENRTFSEISELLDMETPRISEQLDKIAFALRLYCEI